MCPVDGSLFGGEVLAGPFAGGRGYGVACSLVGLVGQDGNAQADAGGDDPMPAGCGEVVDAAGQGW